MRISVLFQFVDERSPAAITGVEGEIADVLLPNLTDTVVHTDMSGNPFSGRVVARTFDYSLSEGAPADGNIAVTLSLERIRPADFSGRPH